VSARTLAHDGTLATTRRADVIWVFRRRRRDWLAQWGRGETSSEFFYGLPTLRDRYRVGFIEDESRSNVVRPWFPVERLIARRIGMGFTLDLALRHVGTLNRARVVVSTVDACGLPLALLKSLGLLRPPLIYISQGLSDRVVAYGPHRCLARLYRRLLLGVDELVTLSAGASAELAAWLGVPAERVRVLPFGIDADFWRDTGARPRGAGAILSVGSDPGRDYTTLLAAAGDLPLHIVTSLPVDLSRHPRVMKTTAHTATELRDLYSAARCTVIALRDRGQPSGQSAALQAMACGQAVVLTRTRGWWGETHLIDGENCVVVRPGDVDGLARAIRRLWDDPAACARIGRAARATAVAHFSERRMAAELAALIEGHLS
jgi:glycosyltransferase involved in cell wall biosynthesis